MYERTQEFAEDTNKQESNSEDRKVSSYEFVENTPFTVVETSKGWGVTLGKDLITEFKKTKEEAIAEAQIIDWNKIVKVITKIMKLNDN